ncbi:RNA-directed DNA polymerase, eukaryota, reverse transcriptase zinc-binding domain protein [Tanacetum coccineum]
MPTLNEKEDKVLWVTNAGLKVCFSTKHAWLDLREDLPNVEWKDVIWFKQFIPKHRFILWLAIQGKLLTQDKMENWNIGGNPLCGFCNQEANSHDHLFFQCDFAKTVWKEICKFSYKFGDQFKLVDLCRDLTGRSKESKFGMAVDKLLLAATMKWDLSLNNGWLNAEINNGS